MSSNGHLINLVALPYFRFCFVRQKNFSNDSDRWKRIYHFPFRYFPSVNINIIANTLTVETFFQISMTTSVGNRSIPVSSINSMILNTFAAYKLNLWFARLSLLVYSEERIWTQWRQSENVTTKVQRNANHTTADNILCLVQEYKDSKRLCKILFTIILHWKSNKDILGTLKFRNSTILVKTGLPIGLSCFAFLGCLEWNVTQATFTLP